MIKISPLDITIPTTLYDLFHGTADVCLQSKPIIDVPGIGKATKNIYEYKQIVTNGGDGKQGSGTAHSFTSPIVFIKPPGTKEFTYKYRLELCDKLNRKQTFRFKTPGAQQITGMDTKSKQQISIKIVDDKKEEIIKRMIEMDNIICMGVEYAMLAEYAKFDFSKCKDDKELIEGLLTTIAPKNHEQLLNMLDPRYFELGKNPPVWVRAEGGVAGNYKIDCDETISEDKRKYLSLFNLIYATKVFMYRTVNSMPQNSLQREVAVNLFDSFKKSAIGFKEFLSNQYANIVPQAKMLKVGLEKKAENEDEPADIEYKTFNIFRMMFYIKLPVVPGGKESKLPDFMYTHKMVKHGGSTFLELDEFKKLLGLANSKPSDKMTGSLNDGFIWFTNRIDLCKFNAYQVHSNWAVANVILTPSTRKFGDQFTVDDSYFNELDEDGTTPGEIPDKQNEAPPPSSAQGQALLDNFEAD